LPRLSPGKLRVVVDAPCCPGLPVDEKSWRSLAGLLSAGWVACKGL